MIYQLSVNTITQCWEHKVELITLIWSLLSCNSSLIWSVFIIPLLLRYPIVHVEPPTVTVYLRIIGCGFRTSITVAVIIHLHKFVCNLHYLTGVAIL